MNKRFELAEKIPIKKLRSLKKHNNEKSLAYIVNYNKNTPELFLEKNKKSRI